MKKMYWLILFITCFFYLQAYEKAIMNDWFVQKNTKTPEGSIIHAKVDDHWQNYKISMLADVFMEWNISERLDQLSIINEMLTGKHGKTPDLSGPHNGIVATYGKKREDSQFALNNAVKGMGFLPKKEKLKEVITLLKETIEKPMPQKIQVLQNLYEKADSIFAKDKQVSLELYSKGQFMTQTFLNQMENPVSTIVFLDIPSFKLKTITRLLDPEDPNLSDYEKDVVNYINLIHSYFHGNFSRDFIGVIYYVIEVYDNSPRGKDPTTGMGKRLIPQMP